MIYILKPRGETAAHARVLRFPELPGGGLQMKRSLDIAAIAMTSLLLLAFAVLSLRGLIDPQTASARFGTPASDIAGSLFYRVYLSRNLVGAVAERDNAAGISSDRARVDRDHRRAALAAGSREPNQRMIRKAGSRSELKSGRERSLRFRAAGCRLGPDAHMATVDLLDVEGPCLPDEIAELAVAVRASVEIREQV